MHSMIGQRFSCAVPLCACEMILLDLSRNLKIISQICFYSDKRKLLILTAASLRRIISILSSRFCFGADLITSILSIEVMHSMLGQRFSCVKLIPPESFFCFRKSSFSCRCEGTDVREWTSQSCGSDCDNKEDMLIITVQKPFIHFSVLQF